MVNLIYIVRHGQSVVNVERRLTGRTYEGDLTDLGREQAVNAAAWLSGKGITRIMSSPFARAQQTAGVIGEQLNLVPQVDTGLSEMDCGDLDGRADDEAWEFFLSIFDRWKTGDWDARYPGGETYRQGYDRYTRVLHSIRSDETVLLVTHGGITISVIPYLCVNAAALQGVNHLSNTGIVILEPYGDGRYICRAWDLTEHLVK